MSFINKMNIGKRLYVVIGGIVLIAFLVFGIYIYGFIAETMEENYTEAINNYLENYYSMVEMELKSKQETAGIALNLADTYFGSLGAISAVPGETVTVGDFNVAKWTQNGKQVQMSNEVVDKYTEMGIEMSSIFQRTDKGFVRIATSVKKDDGSRALGSIILIDSPVGKTVARGETYIGRSYVLGTWLIAAYKPFYINGAVAGVIAVAQPEIDYAALSANFATKKYFGSGYPYIVDGHGILTAHPNAVGTSLAEYDFFPEIVAEKDGKVVYDWKGREKTQYFKYIESIDSYITVGWYTEDYDVTFVKMRFVIGIAVLVSLLVVISVLYVLVKKIVASIQQSVVAAEQLSRGNMNVDLETDATDETGILLNSMSTMAGTMKDLVSEFTDVAVDVANGVWGRRATANDFEGEYHNMATGFNNALDAVINPLIMTVEYVDRISKGDMPPMITEDYKGDFNGIKHNVNLCIESISLLIQDSNMLVEATVAGRLGVRADVSKHSGDFRKIIGGLNNTLDAVINPLMITAEYFDRISKGDMPPMITDDFKGDFNEIKNNVNLCIDSILALITDANMMADAAGAGQLNQRADITKHTGDYASIIKGLNNIMDNVVKPLRLGADYVEKIGQGEIPAKITDTYKGDYAEFINSINACIDGLGALTVGNDVLQKMAMNDVTELVDGDFKGVFGEIKDAINAVNNRIRSVQNLCINISDGDLSELAGLESSGKRCENDQLLPAIVSMMQNIQDLVVEASVLAQAVVVGDLKTRGNTEKFQGEFRNVISGVNDIVNAVVAPIDEAGAVLSKMATGDLTVRMKGAYKGDFEKLKKDINVLGSSLHEMVLQVNDTVDTTAKSASEISSTAEVLAAASQEMNSQADDVASAAEEMARTVTENADGATKTAELARQSVDIADEGGKVVQETVQKMQDIEKVVQETAENIEKLGLSSQAIGEIVSVIDDVADQTNLLALNASIEAARAGEQGRGFAVVADGVRKLAEKTGAATKEIAIQIKSIQKDTADAVLVMKQGTKEVQAGIELSDKAGKSLDNVLSSSNEVTTMIADIAAASEEQAATTEEISKNVLGISQATAESTRQVEDVAGTAEELTQLTNRLSQLMGQFNVSRDGNIDANDDYLLEGGGVKRLS